ncbi:MAG: hypothetical protein LBS87_02895 [Puniceicoccales bacterium]|jgi:hypothetical protein|nr:hypothetical protein [Puniceicoccales bacterium]
MDMSSVVATPMIQQHDESPMPLAPRVSGTDDVPPPAPGISQSITPGAQINTPRSRVVDSKLASRKASSTWQTGVVSFLTGGSFGFVAGNYAHKTEIGSKVFPFLKSTGSWIGSKIAACATSIFSAAVAHPFIAGECAVGCALAGLMIHFLRKLLTRKVCTPEEFRTLVDGQDARFLGRLSRAEASAQHDDSFQSLRRLSTVSPSSASSSEDGEPSMPSSREDFTGTPSAGSSELETSAAAPQASFYRTYPKTPSPGNKCRSQRSDRQTMPAMTRSQAQVT